MTPTSQLLNPAIQPEVLPDYSMVADRFALGFEGFVTQKTREAASRAIQAEFGDVAANAPSRRRFLDEADFVRMVAERIDRNALLEKPYMLLSVRADMERAR